VAQSVKNVGTDLYADPSRRLEVIRLQKKDPGLSLFENLYRRKDGSTFWGRLYVRTARDSEGTEPYFEGFIEDISKNRAKDEALRESEEKFRSIFQNSLAGVALVGLDGRYLAVNPAYSDIFGYPAEKLMSEDFLKLTHPEDVARSQELMRGVLASKGKTLRFTKRYLHKDGHTIWAEVDSALVYGADGKPSHFVTHVVDVTKQKQAEEALRQSEEKYRTLVETADDIILLTDLQGKHLFRNGAYFTSLGYTVGADIELNGYSRVHPDDLPVLQAATAKLMETGTATSEYRIRHRDGHWVYRQAKTIVLYDSNHRPESFLAIIRDITDRKQAEEALRESEEKYRLLFELSPDSIAVYQDGKIIFANPATARLLGVGSPEALIGRPMLDFVHPDYRKLVIERSRQQEQDGRPVPVAEEKFVRQDGGAIDVEVTAAPIQYGGKHAHLVICRDISERLRAGKALRESEEKFRSLFANSLEGMGLSKGNRIIDANKATLEIFGYEKLEEFAAQPLMNHVAPESQAAIRDYLEKAGRGEPYDKRFTYKIVRKNGEKRDVEISVEHLKLGDEVLTQSTFRDVTERKQADEMLREKEERFRATFENANVGVCIVGLDGLLLQVNRQMCAMFGYSRDEMERMTVNTIAYPEDADVSPAFIHQAIAGEADQSGFDKRYIHKDGHVIWGHVSSSLVRDPRGQPLYFISHVQDISDRKQAEDALRESEEKFSKLFQDVPVLIIITDIASGACVDVNEEALRVFGYEREEIIGRALVDIGAITRADRTQLLGAAKTGNQNDGVEVTLQAKDGHSVVGLFRGERITIAGRECMLGAMVDITERKKAEEDLTALALRHEALLAAIPEIVMEVNKNKTYIWANSAGKVFFGEDVIGKPADFYFEGEQETYAAVQPLFNGSEGTIYVESWQRRKDGQKRLLGWWCRTLKDDRGNVTGALSSARDITERRRAEEEIRNLSRFPEENPNSVMRMTPEGVLLYANKASRPILENWKIGVGQPVPGDCGAEIRGAFAARQVTTIETVLGEKIFRCTVAPIVDAGYVNVYSRDITDRRRAEDAVARQTEELRLRNLELARVNELTERRLQQLAAMRTVDMAISSSFKSELVMDILLEQLTSQLKIHAADILIFHPAMQGFRFFCGRGFYSSPASIDYLRLTESYAGRATQERRMVKVPRLDEKKDGPKIFPKIAKEGFVSYACLPLIAKGQIKGVMEICQREPLELTPEEDSFVEMMAGQAAIAIDNAEMFEHLQSSRDELQLAFNSTLAGWARALELRDRESDGETQRGADLAMRLAQTLGESDNNLTNLYRGAILHDVGMMSIPDSILLKPGPLTNEEWAIVHRHPQIAYDILSPVLFLRPALDVPHSHHERWDGSGYPLGSQGEHIPLAGRIFAVVDVWNALRSDRPYRKAWTDAKASDYIRGQAGKQFDPAVVQAFLRLIGGR
jgi:PAS domain S-box-containing protein